MRPFKKSRVSAVEPDDVPPRAVCSGDESGENVCVRRVRGKLDADACGANFVALSSSSQLDTLKAVLRGVAIKRENATVLVLGPRYVRFCGVLYWEINPKVNLATGWQRKWQVRFDSHCIEVVFR
jgi:hypothetical protein